MTSSGLAQVDVADVYKGDRIAATIARSAGGTTFTYTDEYLGDPGPPVASTLPLSNRPVRRDSGSVPPFLAGLLPEGRRLQAVVDAVKTSVDDELSLLLAVGADTVGDVRIVRSGSAPRERAADLPADPSLVEFRSLLAAATDSTTSPLDTALPGVQDKISDSMISFPIKRRKGRAILKLDPSRFPRITANEDFFLSVAARAGFAVPRHELVTDASGRQGLLVHRFDRHTDESGAVTRIAQEDGCQVLDRYPADKYRVTLNVLATRVAELATSPQAAVLDLVLQYAFSWAIGNGDFHAKNYSLQWRPDGIVAATPLYDLVSTIAYPLDQTMAMDLDGRDANFRQRYFVEFGARFDVPSVLTARRLDEMSRRALPSIDGLASIGHDDTTTERMAATITRRFEALAS